MRTQVVRYCCFKEAEKREKRKKRRECEEEEEIIMEDIEGHDDHHHLHKQLGGCMAGFFNIFDRPNLLSPKRLSDSDSLRSSPLKSTTNHKHLNVYSTPELRSPAPDDFKQERSPSSSSSSRSSSPWRFSKEAPRLSLDSRAIVDAKGSLKPRQIRSHVEVEAEPENQRGSPSVIARLMGLEPLPQQPLQRSASESRVTREYRFVDTSNLRDEKDSARSEDPAAAFRSTRAQPARAPPLARRKSFFDSGDFFPEPRQCGDLNKVSKMTGFDTQPTDLETLKQLLEALKLKGLLHSSHKQQEQSRSKNLAYNNIQYQSPIKPTRSACGIRSGPGVSPPASPRKDRGSRGRSQISPNGKSPKREPMLKEEQRRVSPLPWQRPEPVQTHIEDKYSMASRRRSGTVVAEEEMWKVDECNREGKTLLERCEKLLHSIAEMAAAEVGDSQPSPVSVLDASLYHEESSPSPIMKRSLDFTTESEEDESWGESISSSSDSEYVYISDILRAFDCLPQESDIFSLLEKQQYLKGKCASRAAAQERRLIFDAVQEIVGRRRSLPPWRMVGEADKMQVIWSEYQKIRKKKSTTEKVDLVGYVCGVLGRDLSEDRWRDCQVEMSEAVLDIERLLFKDLIGETIRHMAALNRTDSLRRRLHF